MREFDSILGFTASEARTFFLRAENYSTIDLPLYYDFQPLLDEIVDSLGASDHETKLNSILPKLGSLNPQYLTKKQDVITKIPQFVDEFKGVGGRV